MASDALLQDLTLSTQRVYGAVAGVRIDEHANRYAYRKGLFVLTLGRDGLTQILNDEKFVPRNLVVPG